MPCILEQTCNLQLQVCLSIYDPLLPFAMKGLNAPNVNIPQKDAQNVMCRRCRKCNAKQHTPALPKKSTPSGKQ